MHNHQYKESKLIKHIPAAEFIRELSIGYLAKVFVVNEAAVSSSDYHFSVYIFLLVTFKDKDANSISLCQILTDIAFKTVILKCIGLDTILKEGS